MKDASRNSEFAQMPHKGTPIRYGLKPMRNRMQGAEEFPQRGIGLICKQGNFSATQQLGWNLDL